MIKLKPRVDFRVPVEAECISPDVFDGKSAEEIGGLEILWGNKRKGLSEAFEISSGISIGGGDEGWDAGGAGWSRDEQDDGCFGCDGGGAGGWVGDSGAERGRAPGR